jgi:hypothetical protein
MALAVTHVILTIVLIDLYRDYIARNKFPTKYVLLGGVAGLFPDIDIPLGWAYNLLTGSQAYFHGTFTHSVLIPIVLAIASILAYEVSGNRKLGLVLAVISFGWLFHLILDCVFSPYMIFLPFSTIACPFEISTELAIGLDAVILLLWLVHEEWTHKIRDYI